MPEIGIMGKIGPLTKQNITYSHVLQLLFKVSFFFFKLILNYSLKMSLL